MNIPAWLAFILKSILLGLLISALLLFLVPELRNNNSFNFNLFDDLPSPASKLTFNSAIRRAAPAVVNIYSNSTDVRSSLILRQQVERTQLGSGVIMNAKGYVLTCFHVIKGAESITVALQDGHRAEAQVVGFDMVTDLAVLKINGDNFPVIPQLESTEHQVGDLVLAIGNPYNLGQTITQGIISRTGRKGLSNFTDYIQMDAALNEGNSGGALVDSNGYLLGINNANFKTLDRNRRVKEVDGVSFAVPYELAKRIMEEIVANGKVTRGQLGFTGEEILNNSGIVVTAVASGSPAQVAGLQPGDILMAIDGKEVEGAAKALDLIAETAPGTLMALHISRNNQAYVLDAVVGELLGR